MREGVDGVQDSSPDSSRASCDNLVVVTASPPVAAPQQSENSVNPIVVELTSTYKSIECC
jgi:hypothetical protein